MYRNRFNLRKVVVIAIYLVGFSVGNVLAQDNTTDQGVVINGVKWATRNVDKPGTFAATPESTGMFYQWNRRVGWSTTDPITNSNGASNWNDTGSEGTMWEKSNDPSPVGWRVPTVYEIMTLLDTQKVKNEWTTKNGIYGRKFTDIASGVSIFLPATGNLCTFNRNPTLYDVGSKGNYWSSSQSSMEYNKYNAYGLFFLNDRLEYGVNARSCGNAIRSVAE